MIDWLQLRELMWEARWDAVVMIVQSILTNVASHWWFGPLMVFIGVAASRRAWLRLLR
jgi:hypothetical protein